MKSIVTQYAELYRDYFSALMDWEILGKCLLVELIRPHPELMTNTIALQLTFRVAVVKVLSELTENRLD